MELLEGNKYTTNEMIAFFQVSKDTWKKKKEELLFHFQAYYEYEVEYDEKDHRKKLYHIIKKNHDYEPPLKKSVKRDKTYQKKIIESLEDNNLQTAKSVSRNIKDTPEILAFKHKEGTTYEVTRNNMRVMFGTKAGESGTMGFIKEKIWCRLDGDNNCYIPLEPQEIEDLYALFKSERKEFKEAELSIMSEYEQGLISHEEMKEQVSFHVSNYFCSVKNTYKAKHDFFPVKVPRYEISAYETTEEEAA